MVIKSGAGAIDYIIDHAEIDYVFVHPLKVKEVSTSSSYTHMCLFFV